jgi:hypothetical protein
VVISVSRGGGELSMVLSFEKDERLPFLLLFEAHSSATSDSELFAFWLERYSDRSARPLPFHSP